MNLSWQKWEHINSSLYLHGRKQWSIKDSTYFTDVKASSPISCLSTNNPIVPIKEMDFGTPSAVHEEKTVPAMETTEIINTYVENSLRSWW